MSTLVSRFESIGDNCEFGFVQRANGFDEGGLLRWALLGGDALLAGLQNRFSGIYTFENLEPAGGGTMVFDRLTGIAFHTQMHATETDGRWVFNHDDLQRRAIHAEEFGKIKYLLGKFWETLSAGEKVLVFKNNRVVDPGFAKRLLQQIRCFGTCPLLYVDPQGPGEVAGSVARVADGLYRGVIDWFPSYDKTNEASYDCWMQICHGAVRLHDGALV